jgi:hypothetical protein
LEAWLLQPFGAGFVPGIPRRTLPRIMACRRRQLKKRSAAKPPDQPVFFIDRSLGKIDVPDALRSEGYRCELHDSHFEQQTEDAIWLRDVATHQWVVLTKDERIRYRPLEFQALVEARVRAFIVVCGNVRGIETAEILRRAMPKILKVIASQRGPFVYYVYKNSTLKRAVIRRNVFGS